MLPKSTYNSRLYRSFLALRQDDFHGIIRYYEGQEDAISSLDEEEQTLLLLQYTQALYRVGAHRQYMAVVDETLLKCIDFPWTNDPVQEATTFQELLFQKANSLMRLLQPAAAERVLRELLAIDPQYPKGASLLRESIRVQDRWLSRQTRATAIILFGLSALVILVEILLVRPFYYQHTTTVEWSRNLIFLAGTLSLLGGELVTFWRAHRTAINFVNQRRHH